MLTTTRYQCLIFWLLRWFSFSGENVHIERYIAHTSIWCILHCRDPSQTHAYCIYIISQDINVRYTPNRWKEKKIFVIVLHLIFTFKKEFGCFSLSLSEHISIMLICCSLSSLSSLSLLLLLLVECFVAQRVLLVASDDIVSH